MLRKLEGNYTEAKKNAQNLNRPFLKLDFTK